MLYYVTVVRIKQHTHTSDLREFYTLVEDALDEGWKLQGGVSVTLDGNDSLMAQAMTKEGE